MYIKIKSNHYIIIVVYVDDIIFGRNKDKLYKDFINKMQKEFKISMIGELSYFLDLQVIKKEKHIFISQIKYVKEMFKKFTMEDSKPVSTPMMIGYKLSKDDKYPHVDQIMDRFMIRSLLYLIMTRSNTF